jgi:hypothetical protein
MRNPAGNYIINKLNIREITLITSNTHQMMRIEPEPTKMFYCGGGINN